MAQQYFCGAGAFWPTGPLRGQALEQLLFDRRVFALVYGGSLGHGLSRTLVVGVAGNTLGVCTYRNIDQDGLGHADVQLEHKHFKLALK